MKEKIEQKPKIEVTPEEEERKKKNAELSDFVFGKVPELLAQKKFSPKDFNKLLEKLTEKGVIKRITSLSKTEFQKEKQKKEGNLIVESIGGENPAVFGASYLGLGGAIFQFLPELRARVLSAEKGQKEIREKKSEARRGRQKELITHFDEVLKGPRELVKALKGQMSEKQRGEQNAVVNRLSAYGQQIAGAVKKEKVVSAQSMINELKEAGIKEFTHRDFQEGILPEAEEHNLVKKVSSETFDLKAQKLAEREGRELTKKPERLEFVYPRWETDPKTGKSALQIDLYRFIGERESEVARDIFNELRLYALLIEPLDSINYSRERYRRLNDTTRFRERMSKKAGRRLGIDPRPSTKEPAHDLKTQAADLLARLAKEEQTPKQSDKKKGKGKGKKSLSAKVHANKRQRVEEESAMLEE